VSSSGNAPLRPGLTSLITRRVGPHEQGLVLGLSQSLNSIAQIAAPLVATAVIGRHMLGVWALLAGGFAAAALAVPTRDDERAASETASV
jgi:MFS family permease